MRFRIPNRLLEMGYQPTIIAVYAVLARHANWKTQAVYPGEKRIAQTIRRGERTVRNALRRLEADHFIKTSFRKTSSGRRGNVYTLLDASVDRQSVTK